MADFQDVDGQECSPRMRSNAVGDSVDKLKRWRNQLIDRGFACTANRMTRLHGKFPGVTAPISSARDQGTEANDLRSRGASLAG